MFESEVYQLERQIEFSSINWLEFSRFMSMNRQEGVDALVDYYSPVRIQVAYRGSVASRHWYSIEWTDIDGQSYTAEAQTFQKALFRAVNRHRRVKRRLVAQARADAFPAGEYQI